MIDDLRIALRQHLRHRGFPLTVVCTLALATGATTAVVTVVNSVLVRARWRPIATRSATCGTR